MSSITLRTTPDSLWAKADSIEQQIGKIEKEMKNIWELAAGLHDYWDGNAEEVYQKRCRELKNETGEVTCALRNSAEKLSRMARVYADTEQSIGTAVGQLSVNVIN